MTVEWTLSSTPLAAPGGHLAPQKNKLVLFEATVAWSRWDAGSWLMCHIEDEGIELGGGVRLPEEGLSAVLGPAGGRPQNTPSPPLPALHIACIETGFYFWTHLDRITSD